MIYIIDMMLLNEPSRSLHQLRNVTDRNIGLLPPRRDDISIAQPQTDLTHVAPCLQLDALILDLIGIIRNGWVNGVSDQNCIF